MPGMPNAQAASIAPWAAKGGSTTNSFNIDLSEQNQFVHFADSTSKTPQPYLVGADANNQTRVGTPQGVAVRGGISMAQLAQVAAPTITNVGTAGVTTYTYVVVAKGGTGATLNTAPASSAGTTTTGNASLSTTNYNVVTWTHVAGASSYDVYRTVGGATQGVISNVTATHRFDGTLPTYTLNDTGLAGDSTTAPTTNTTGAINTPSSITAGSVTAYTGTVAQLATPSAPTITVVGAAAGGSYSYKIVANNGSGATAGTSIASNAGTINPGATTPSATNYNVITFSGVSGATSYTVYRTAGGANQGVIATIPAVYGTNGVQQTSYVVNDTALSGDSTTAPTANTSGSFIVPLNVCAVGGSITLAQLNAGATIVPAVTGRTYRPVGFWLQFNGAFTTATDIRLSDTAGSPVDIVTVAIAGATNGANVTQNGGSNITVSTTGFAQQLTANAGIQLRKTGSSAAGGTSIFYMVQFVVNS